MTKPKGKTPSLLSISTGLPTIHTCGRATHCDRCKTSVETGHTCFQIPKMESGFTNHPIFCIQCMANIVEQTKADLSALEEMVQHIQKG
jgi:hypothetical protein